jgi:uncharacterized protein (UPF0332 family)
MDEDIKDSLALALDTFDDAKFMAQYQRYRGAMNRCYYSYYYLVKGILVSRGIVAKTHKGLNTEFSKLYKNERNPLRIRRIFRLFIQRKTNC